MIYLDNSATTRPRPEVVAAVNAALTDDFGNPSSVHGLGARAERLLRDGRQAVAGALGAMAEEIVFTSGGTEANNLALLGAARACRRHGDHIITTRIEHPSVLRACAMLEDEGFRVTYLDVDREGIINPAALARALAPATILVSTMHVNNETGAVQPLAAVARVLGRLVPGIPPGEGSEVASAAGSGPQERGARRVLWHVDAVQSLGKLPVQPRRLGIDLLSVSAHKIHGPKGCGALYIRKGVSLRPLVGGGGQEGGRRPGTENVPGIAGFGAAVRLAAGEQAAALDRLTVLRERFLAGLERAVPWVHLNGPRRVWTPADASAPAAAALAAVNAGLAPDGSGLAGGAAPASGGGRAAPHIINVSFPGLRGEALVHALGERKVYASTGAACSSRRAEPSHVLRAMGLAPAEIEGALRCSFSPLTTEAEVDGAVTAIAAVVAELRPFVRR